MASNYFNTGPQGELDYPEYGPCKVETPMKFHMNSKTRVIPNHNVRQVPCQGCVDGWKQHYSSHDWGYQGDPEIYDACHNCTRHGATEFDQTGNLVCLECATRSMIRKGREDNTCWQCEKSRAVCYARSSLSELVLCEKCQLTHFNKNLVSRNKTMLHSCTDVCVFFFLSQIAATLEDILQIQLPSFPTCIADVVARYIGADVSFSNKFSVLHEMLFL